MQARGTGTGGGGGDPSCARLDDGGDRQVDVVRVDEADGRVRVAGKRAVHRALAQDLWRPAAAKREGRGTVGPERRVGGGPGGARGHAAGKGVGREAYRGGRVARVIATNALCIGVRGVAAASYGQG